METKLKKLLNDIYDRLQKLDYGQCAFLDGPTTEHLIFEVNEEDKYDNGVRFVKLWLHWLFAQKIVTARDFIPFPSATCRELFRLYLDETGVVLNDQKAVLYNTTARVTGHCLIHAFGNCDITAFDTSFVTAYDNTKVKATDCMVVAFNSAFVEIRGYGKAELWDNTKGEASGQTMVIAHEDAICSVSSGVHLLRR